MPRCSVKDESEEVGVAGFVNEVSGDRARDDAKHVTSVVFMADVGKNTKLRAVGQSYGVKKLTTDAPHWSLDGH